MYFNIYGQTTFRIGGKLMPVYKVMQTNRKANKSNEIQKDKKLIL